MELNLKGKRAVMTGGASGLCYTVAKAFYDAGADVLLADRDSRVKEATGRMETDREVKYLNCDLSDLGSLSRVYREMLEKLDGRIDILFNGAGIQYRCSAASFPLDRWKMIMDVNLNAVFMLSQMAGNTMIEQGYGKIINMASMTSFFGSEMVPAYAASKGAVAQLTKALSNEWASKGINVNAIAPGYMETKLTSDMKEKNPKQYYEITNRIPMKRWGKPEDLSGLAVFLASDVSSYISGAVIPADGGYLGK